MGLRNLLNQKAPQFSLPDQSGKIHSLSDYQGQWVVLYFYPKDDTPGCTKEACSFRDHIQKLKEKGVVVFGVSADSVSSHQKFVQKYRLNFPLLADPEKNVIKAYGVWGKKKFLGREFEGVLRTTFLIDKEGKIKKIYENVKPENHAQEILADLAT